MSCGERWPARPDLGEPDQTARRTGAITLPTGDRPGTFDRLLSHGAAEPRLAGRGEAVGWWLAVDRAVHLPHVSERVDALEHPVAPRHVHRLGCDLAAGRRAVG